jgi:hypothetical protein
LYVSLLKSITDSNLILLELSFMQMIFFIFILEFRKLLLNCVQLLSCGLKKWLNFVLGKKFRMIYWLLSLTNLDKWSMNLVFVIFRTLISWLKCENVMFAFDYHVNSMSEIPHFGRWFHFLANVYERKKVKKLSTKEII